MNGAFYIGATGLNAEQRALEAIANNVANINTTAFKRSTVRFSELVMPLQSGDEPSSNLPARSAALSGVGVGATSRIWSQGDLRQTGGQMDLAIDGPGFLEVLGPAGRSLLWRGGTLKVNADGYLAAADGTPLSAMISVPQAAKAISIGRDGMVAATVDGEAVPQRLGQIELVMVKDLDDLHETGNGYFELADTSASIAAVPGEEGGGALVQGAVETANVQLSDEMVTLLLLQRAYAASAQVVQAGDQLMSIANNLRR